MTASLQDILGAVNSLTQQVNNIVKIEVAIPSVSSLGPSSQGALVFVSSQPTAFIVIQTSSGGTYRVPAYNAF